MNAPIYGYQTYFTHLLYSAKEMAHGFSKSDDSVHKKITGLVKASNSKFIATGFIFNEFVSLGGR